MFERFTDRACHTSASAPGEAEVARVLSELDVDAERLLREADSMLREARRQG